MPVSKGLLSFKNNIRDDLHTLSRISRLIRELLGVGTRYKSNPYVAWSDTGSDTGGFSETISIWFKFSAGIFCPLHSLETKTPVESLQNNRNITHKKSFRTWNIINIFHKWSEKYKEEAFRSVANKPIYNCTELKILIPVCEADFLPNLEPGGLTLDNSIQPRRRSSKAR